ncbi:hypothetical protein, partial [Moorena sp. SIO4A1]|uniref:hypothetical protein n=1 Tax=Moorena sp. SIO4A1 TaxID=2607835 RepID=UPI0025F279B6
TFSILHSTFKWVLVGIAHVIARRSIMIFISNSHPTILNSSFYILNSSFYIQMGIGGHCPFNCSGFNHDLYQQFPPYESQFFILHSQFFILHSNGYWWALPI